MYMIDLETLGRAPDGVIASIGACRFDIQSGEILDTFHVHLNVRSQPRRHVHPDTALWWMQQSEAAQRELYGSTDLAQALLMWQDWARHDEPCWANGATFDHAIMNHAYEQMGLRNPIHYKRQWCMRPFRSIVHNVAKKPREGTHHNALDDAIYQAEWLSNIVASLGTVRWGYR